MTENQEQRPMMIVEGLKRLGVIQKRMESNIRSINQYASIVSNERPLFGDEKTQKKEVQALIQSNIDLHKEALKLKNRIERTNLQTIVEIQGVGYTISDLLFLDRSMKNLISGTYEALNTKYAQGRLAQMGMRGSHVAAGETLRVEHMYDEKAKNEQLRVWNDLFDNISARLEVINATTPLLD